MNGEQNPKSRDDPWLKDARVRISPPRPLARGQPGARTRTPQLPEHNGHLDGQHFTPPSPATASHKPLVSLGDRWPRPNTRLTQRPEIICHIDLFSNFHIFMTRLLPDSQTASPRQRRWGRTSPAYLARLVAPTPVALLRLLRPSSRAPGHHKDNSLGRDVSVRDTAVCARVHAVLCVPGGVSGELAS